MPRPGLPPLPDVDDPDPFDDENQGVDSDWRHDSYDEDW